MKKFICLVVLISNIFFVYTNNNNTDIKFHSSEKFESFENYVYNIYRKLSDPGIHYPAIKLAIKGYYNLRAENLILNNSILTFIDYSKSSKIKRMYIIDLTNNKILYKSLVAHGKNSGLNYATNFSNIQDSYKSSLGFYITDKTYIGKHGYSLRLEGMETNYNSNAKKKRSTTQKRM